VSDTPIVRALPVFASNGDELDLLVDAEARNGGPYLWRCRFRKSAPDPYKWHVIGEGPALSVETESSITGLGTAYAIGTNGLPPLYVPARGVYRVGLGARLMNNAGGQYIYVSYSIGGAAPNDWADGIFSSAHDSATRVWASFARWKTKTFGAVTTLQVQARTSAGGSSYNFQDCWLHVRPVRIGPG
jgi:hypothetical protein